MDDDWYQIQDLIVEKTRKEMIFLGESVLQVGRATFRPLPFHSHIRRSGSEDARLRRKIWRSISNRLHIRSNKANK